MLRRIMGLALLALPALGCTGSRWARSDEIYANKYPRHSDNLLQMAKQAVDARHVARREGFYTSATAADSPFTAGAGVGIFGYYSSWCERRVGLTGLVGTGDENLFGGISGGLRIQSPTRLAPFVGVGAFGGLGLFGEAADNDGIDNDDDFFIDEPDETRETGYLAAYPETGLHFWLTPRLRLTGSAAYNFSTAGREHDAWMFNMELAFLGSDSPPPLPERTDEPIDFGELALRRLPAVR